MAGERPECQEFFRFIHKFRVEVASEVAKESSAKLNLPAAEIEKVLDAACEKLLFRVFTALDGVSGHDDFPNLELVDENGRSLNGAYLHDLYFQFKPQP
jgi:hypothetical protein